MWNIYDETGKRVNIISSQEEAQNVIEEMARTLAPSKWIAPEDVRTRWSRGNSNYYMVARPDCTECSYWPSAIGKLTKAEYTALKKRMGESDEINEARI